jgi:biotin carboxyl carrier protein
MAAQSGTSDSRDSLVVKVSARPVTEKPFQDAVTAPGQWRSVGQVGILSPFAGVVDSIAIRPGDRVRQGEIVCRLITRESRAALLGAEILARQAHDEASRAEAEQALVLARREVVRVPLPAPCAGVVTAVSAQPGSEVAESDQLAEIQAPDAVFFEARIDPSDVARVREGGSASITTGAAEQTRDAVVQRILPLVGAADQATLAWLAPRSKLPPQPEIGRFGMATILTGPPRRAAAVPDSAVVQDDLTGRTHVVVIDARDRAIWTPVTLGAAAGGWHELRAPGIAPGTLVITQGQRGLPDSTRVDPTP